MSQDRVANALALTKSIVDLPNSPTIGSTAELAKDIYDWMVRERINRTSFDLCTDLAKNLAFPNEQGYGLKQNIENQDVAIQRSKKKVPFNLIASGSLGRLICRDESLCYVATTVACLANCHNTEYTTKFLCEMLFDQYRQQGKPGRDYMWQWAPVRQVVGKIVESVFINVVNAGLDLAGLPDELSGLFQHSAGPETLARLAAAIQRTDKSIFIRADLFYTDLFLWFLYHFEGYIEVSVDNEILFFRETTTSFTKRLHMYCRSCSEENHVHGQMKSSKIEAGTMSGGTYTCFYKSSQTSHSGYATPIKDYNRIRLYDEERINSTLHPSGEKQLNPAQTLELTNAAQGVVKWLLDVRLASCSKDHLGEFILEVIFDNDEKFFPRTYALQKVFSRYPKLANSDTGLFAVKLPAASNHAGSAKWSSDAPDSSKKTVLTLDDILGCFPHTEQLINMSIKKHCSCEACKTSSGMGKAGCLRLAAMTFWCSLVAHSIADAFGANDLSGMTDASTIPMGITDIFSELFLERIIRWNTWFRLVGSLSTGTPWSMTAQSSAQSSLPGPNEDYTLAAFQHGSLVVVPPLLDLASWQSIDSAFACTILQGSVEGMNDEVGIIYSEPAGRESTKDDITSLSSSGHANWFDLNPALEADTLCTEMWTSIFSIGSSRYHMVHIVRTGKLIRIISPFESISNVIRIVEPNCNHASNQPVEECNSLVNAQPATEAMIYDFAQLLQIWGAPIQIETIRISRLLEDPLKVNVALSLGSTPEVIILRKDQCCLQCAVDAALKDPKDVAPIIIMKEGQSMSLVRR